MAKVDKEYKLRMEGYVQGLRFAKEHGLEELEKDVKRRGFLSIPVQITKKEVDKFILQMSENLTHTMRTVMLYTLHRELGFGKKRLQRINEMFDKHTNAIFNFDYLGNHYVKIEDYAIEMNRKYDLGLDIDRVAACQDTCRYEKDNIRMANVDVLIQRLYEYGFEDAAEWMERMVE